MTVNDESGQSVVANVVVLFRHLSLKVMQILFKDVLNNLLTDGEEVVSLTRRPPFPPRRFLVPIC
jgi:hypothetical protein